MATIQKDFNVDLDAAVNQGVSGRFWLSCYRWFGKFGDETPIFEAWEMEEASLHASISVRDAEDGNDPIKLVSDIPSLSPTYLSSRSCAVSPAASPGMAPIQDSRTVFRTPDMESKVVDKKVTSLSLSPAASLLAVSSLNTSTISILSTTPSISRTRTLTGHKAHVNVVRFFPSGQVVLSASGDMSAKVWDVATGQCGATLVAHTGGVTDVAIVARGRNVITSSRDSTVRLWSLASPDTPLRTVLSLTGDSITRLSLATLSPSTSSNTFSNEVETGGKALWCGTGSGRIIAVDLSAPVSAEAGETSIQGAVADLKLPGGRQSVTALAASPAHGLVVAGESPQPTWSLFPVVTDEMVGQDTDAVGGCAVGGWDGRSGEIWTGAEDGVVRKYAIRI
ncbi:hypothetical protein HDU93_003765 [Gonapodya sp. JEL0774]|nr:hypothetical protein HDU93_003765 [Gonapodya sp. JEL0774]